MFKQLAVQYVSCCAAHVCENPMEIHDTTLFTWFRHTVKYKNVLTMKTIMVFCKIGISLQYGDQLC